MVRNIYIYVYLLLFYIYFVCVRLTDAWDPFQNTLILGSDSGIIISNDPQMKLMNSQV